MRFSPALGIGIALTFTGAPAAAGEAMIIAPFPIADGTGRLPKSALAALEQYLSARLAAYPDISLIPSRDIKSLLKRQKEESFQDCYDESCQIELGKELAATHIITPELNALGSQCVFSAFLYELRTATTRSASTVRTRCDEDALLAALDRVVSQLVGASPGQVRLKPKPAPASPPVAKPVPKLRRRPPPPPPPVAKAQPRRRPKPANLVPTAEAQASADDEGWAPLAGTIWLSAGAALVAGGVVVDTVPSSSSNGELEAVDFVPIGLYAAGAAAVIIGTIALLDD